MDIMLTAKNGSLGINGDVILFFYPAGDCDTLPWPLTSEFRTDVVLRQQLASALFDCREMGELPADIQCVLLPDETTFYIDTNLNLT